LDLAISIAAGHPWLGFSQGLGFSPQQAGAVYIDYALDPGLKERIRVLLIAHKWPENLPINFGQESFLHSPQDIVSLLADVLPLKAGFIVLDSLFGMRLELNARQAPSLAPYLVSLDHLSKEANAAVLVLHDLRSHRTNLGSALVAMGVDHVLAAESQFGDDRVHLRTLSSIDGTRIAVNAQVQHSRNFAHLSLSSSTPPCQLGMLGKRLLRHLLAYGQATTAQLVSSFPHSSPKRISNLIQELLTDGYIYRSNSGGRGIPAAYRITPAGCQVKEGKGSFIAQPSAVARRLKARACPEEHLRGDVREAISACQVKGGFTARRCEVEPCSDEAIPHQVSTTCQVSTAPAPASAGFLSTVDCQLPTVSGVYNPGFHNPFVLQRKPCSE
jgi:hypothetical protein